MNHIPKTVTLLLFFFLLVFSCRQDPKSGTEGKVEYTRTGNDLIVRIEGEPDNLNYLLATTSFSSQIVNQIFSFLLVVDPETLDFIPQLVVKRPEIKEITEGKYQGGLSYTFEIHPGAVWDDGKPVTANDFIFTLKASLNPKVPADRIRPYLSPIKEVLVNAENPKIFTVLTAEKFLSGEEYISSTVPVMAAHHYDPDGLLTDIPLTDFTDSKRIAQIAVQDDRLQRFADQFTDPKYARDIDGVLGSGPYKLTEWTTGQRVVLVRKEGWWGNGMADKYPALTAYPNEIVFKPIPDAASAIAALKAEEIDAMTDIPPNEFVNLKETELVTKAYNLYSPTILAFGYIAVNTRSPKLNDKRVRQALAYALDGDEIIATAYSGLGQRIIGPVHPSLSYYSRELDPIKYNPEKARQLLKDAGWEDTNNNGVVDKEIDGQRVEMNLTYHFSTNRDVSRTIALLLQNQAKSAGINIEPEGMDFNNLITAQKSGNFELSAAARALAPVWEPKQSYHTEGDNRTGFGNAETDALIDEIMVTLDDQKRNALYKELQAILYDEMPEIYLLALTGRIAIHKRFEAPMTAMYPGYMPNLFKLKAE